MKTHLILIVCLLFFACKENPRYKHFEDNMSVNIFDTLRKGCKAISITFQVPNSKTSLVAREFNNKDSIDMIFKYFGSLIQDTTTFCIFRDWGDIYFYEDSSRGDYFYDLYFSTDQNCFIFQDYLGKKANKYIMTKQGRLYLNKLQKEFNIPSRWHE